MSLQGAEYYTDCTFCSNWSLSVCTSEEINEFYIFTVLFVIINLYAKKLSSVLDIRNW